MIRFTAVLLSTEPSDSETAAEYEGVSTAVLDVYTLLVYLHETAVACRFVPQFIESTE
jgi:hypothetical protein